MARTRPFRARRRHSSSDLIPLSVCEQDFSHLLKQSQSEGDVGTCSRPNTVFATFLPLYGGMGSQLDWTPVQQQLVGRLSNGYYLRSLRFTLNFFSPVANTDTVTDGGGLSPFLAADFHVNVRWAWCVSDFSKGTSTFPSHVPMWSLIAGATERPNLFTPNDDESQDAIQILSTGQFALQWKGISLGVPGDHLQELVAASGFETALTPDMSKTIHMNCKARQKIKENQGVFLLLQSTLESVTLDDLASDVVLHWTMNGSGYCRVHHAR